MKEIPILFTEENIRKIEKNLKWQTRRIAHPEDYCINNKGLIPVINRYGIPGDILYVKQTHYRLGHWVTTGEFTPTGKQKWDFVSDGYTFLFEPPI